jgi:SPP1 gp7 family putative phage head morphogenesis protein
VNDIINSTLAAKFSLHQDKQLSVADGLADTVDAKLQTILNRMVRVLRSKAGPTEKKYAIRSDLYKVILITNEIMARGLAHMATSSHADAATVLVKTIPKGHLSLITEKKPILEDRKAEMETEIKGMIFDPLSAEKVQTIVRGTTAGASWQSRLAQQTSLAPPEHLATILTQDFNGQKSPAELARVLKDHVGGVASTARRVARNESMRIAHESRMDAYEDLGDLVIGYQIHATMDTRVRPEHAARSGQVYYKKPVSGQLGLDKMPRPPLEEDGTVAHNCRCWITPVLSVNQEIEKDPAAKKMFSDAAGKLIPNPAVYSDWFDRAPEADKARVVGAKRLSIIRGQLTPGQSLNWGHFVNPTSGKLLDASTLVNESPEGRKDRLTKFKYLITKRKELTQKVYTYGYLPPKIVSRPQNMSLRAIVIKQGGITPKSIHADFNYKEDIKQFGLITAMRKTGVSLDIMAQSLEMNGHIIVPDNRNGDDYLLELLQNDHHSLLERNEKHLDDEYNEWAKLQAQIKAEGHDERDLKKIRRDSKAAGILAAQEQVAQELSEWSPQSPASLAAQQERDKKLANEWERERAEEEAARKHDPKTHTADDLSFDFGFNEEPKKHKPKS